MNQFLCGDPDCTGAQSSAGGESGTLGSRQAATLPTGQSLDTLTHCQTLTVPTALSTGRRLTTF